MSKTIVITGASDGIGATAAARLHREGHRVVVVGRDTAKTEATADQLEADRYTVDFSRLDDVRTLASQLDKAYERIDVLANNAGGIFGDPPTTVDGFETTFQVNHLAPFLLTNLLMDKLIGSNASVIQSASVAARLYGRIDLDNLEHARAPSPTRAYGTAKLANILFTTELHRRYHAKGIAAAAFHPGLVATSFASNTKSFLRGFYGNRIGRAFLISPDRGADQLVWLANGEVGTDWASGTYFEKQRPAKRMHPQTRDADLARTLWDRSAELLNLSL